MINTRGRGQIQPTSRASRTKPTRTSTVYATDSTTIGPMEERSEASVLMRVMASALALACGVLGASMVLEWMRPMRALLVMRRRRLRRCWEAAAMSWWGG